MTPVKLAIRFAHNALILTRYIGEAVTIGIGYLQVVALRLVHVDGLAAALTPLFIVLLFCAGGVALAGLAVSAWRGERAVPLFAAAYMALLCLTPFPDQFPRYLAPVAPLVVLGLMQFPRPRALARVVPALLAAIFIAKGIVLADVLAFDHQPASYTAADGSTRGYRLFFYEESARDFDRTIDFISAHAERRDIVAAGTPHRIYLRTGLKSVMPPFESDARTEQQFLDSVPVTFLMVGHDVIASERYTVPAIEQFPDRWTKVFASPEGYWTVYRRTPGQ